jgi:hypothetical protein
MEPKRRGRPALDRKIKNVTLSLFVDQLPVTSKEAREAIDHMRAAQRLAEQREELKTHGNC